MRATAHSQTRIAPPPFDRFHDGGDRLLARVAVEAFLNRGLERLVPRSSLPIAANQIPDVLTVVYDTASDRSGEIARRSL